MDNHNNEIEPYILNNIRMMKINHFEVTIQIVCSHSLTCQPLQYNNYMKSKVV